VSSRRSKSSGKRPSHGHAISPSRNPDAGFSRLPGYAALLILVAVLAYSNSFNNPFVFDDMSSIVTNTNIRELSSAAALSGPVQSAIAGRPLVSFSLAINYALGALNPWGYHVWNLAVHILAGLLLFGIVRRTLSLARIPARLRERAAGISLAVAVVWVVHPLNSEIVNYVTQRTEAMMGLFYFLTLYAANRAMTGGSNAWSAAAVVACACGMASKEPMATVPLMVWLYDAVFVSGSLRQALRQHASMYAGLAATWLLLAALVFPGPRWRSAGFASGVTPWTYLLNQPTHILEYLELSVWPHPLLLDYGLTKPIPLSSAIVPGIAIIGLLVATAVTWFRWPALAFLATWFWITLAPSSSILPIATEVGAERRMYLPLAAVVVLATLGVDALLRRVSDHKHRAFAGAALAIVCSAFVWLTFTRNREYRSELEIWQTVLDRRPNGRAHYNVAIALNERGRIDEAIDHWKMAFDDEPRAHYALGFEYEKMGRLEDAVREYQQFLDRRPDDQQAPEAHIRLGAVLGKLERFDEAVKTLERAVWMRPRNADARFELANALMGDEQYKEAATQYVEHLQLSPSNAVALENLGLALIAQQRENEALDPLKRAVALQPKEGRTRLILANALAATGQLDEAIEQYREGIALVPNSPTLHRNLAATLLKSGRPQEALKSLEAALAIEPDDADTRQTYEELRRALGR
jgi:protein O-mannosyl-transferase